MMKNAFHFTVKALFVFKIFKFLFCNHVEIWLDKKAKVKFKNYDVTNWITNNYDTYIWRYVKK